MRTDAGRAAGAAPNSGSTGSPERIRSETAARRPGAPSAAARSAAACPSRSPSSSSSSPRVRPPAPAATRVSASAAEYGDQTWPSSPRRAAEIRVFARDANARCAG
ncbi:hypothetical protein ACFQXA_23740 [Nocardiopsis composta]